MSRQYFTYALLALTIACSGCSISAKNDASGNPPAAGRATASQESSASNKDSSSEAENKNGNDSPGQNATTINFDTSPHNNITGNGKSYPKDTNSNNRTTIIVKSPEDGGITVNGKPYSGHTLDIDDISSTSTVTKGNGKPASVSRAAAPFHQIDLEGSIDIIATIGPKVSVVVSGDSNIVPLVRTTTQKGELTVDTLQSYSPNLPPVVKIVAPSLDQISLNGSGGISAHGLQDNNIALNINGSGNLDADGNTNALSINVAGSGDVNAQNMKAAQVDVTVNGSGNVNVAPTRSINANVNGSGNIIYHGDTLSVHTNVNGSGSISRG